MLNEKVEQLLKFEKTISAKAVVLEHKLDATKEELNEKIDTNHAEVTIRMKQYNDELIERLNQFENSGAPQMSINELNYADSFRDSIRNWFSLSMIHQ